MREMNVEYGSSVRGVPARCELEVHLEHATLLGLGQKTYAYMNTPTLIHPITYFPPIKMRIQGMFTSYYMESSLLHQT